MVYIVQRERALDVSYEIQMGGALFEHAVASCCRSLDERRRLQRETLARHLHRLVPIPGVGRVCVERNGICGGILASAGANWHGDKRRRRWWWVEVSGWRRRRSPPVPGNLTRTARRRGTCWEPPLPRLVAVAPERMLPGLCCWANRRDFSATQHSTCSSQSKASRVSCKRPLELTLRNRKDSSSSSFLTCLLCWI